MPNQLTDDFENGLSRHRWSAVVGAKVGRGCGELVPLAYGNSLYFNGCGLRHAITVEVNATSARYIF